MGFENIFARKGQTEAFGPVQSKMAVEFPPGYREQMRWVPRIGDIFPNFHADSTHGSLDFHSYAEGRWIYFLTHPCTESAVSATEMAGIASSAPYFQQRGVEILGICSDTAAKQARWQAEIGRIFHLQIDFPVIEDCEKRLIEAFDMNHPRQYDGMAIRKSFIIDPSLRVRMIFEYPMNIGRSMDETLRVIDALQIADRHNVGVPGDWEAGDSVLIRHDMSDKEAYQIHGSINRLAPFLRLVPVPSEDGEADQHPFAYMRERAYGS